MEKYTAACKLMLFGEYVVLCGSKSLAIPLKFNQSLKVEDADCTIWESYRNGELWFQMKLEDNFNLISTSNELVAANLLKIFKTIKSNSSNTNFKKKFTVDANFNLEWGIGSSSTLISLLSQWSKVDWRKLLDKSFGGSGYDVACATATSPMVYSIDGLNQAVTLSKNVTDKLMFIYSGNKQSSSREVNKFNKNFVDKETVMKVSSIVDAAISSNSIEVFEKLIHESEDLMSSVLKRPKISEVFFQDYPYSIKSLGAWGGDFFLATCRDKVKAREYFRNKGYPTHFMYNEIIIQ